MKWVIGNLHVQVSDASDPELRWLDEYLSFSDNAWQPGRKEARRIRMLNPLTEQFPTGLARPAYTEAKKVGHRVDVVDARVVPAVPDTATDLEWLRHHPAVPHPITHQIEAVQAVWARKRGIIWAPVGSGKTEIAIGLVKSIPCRWLFLVHLTDLVGQTAERYAARTGDTAGIIGDGTWQPGDRFTVAMFQTLWARMKDGDPEAVRLLNAAEGLIIDECHSMSAETFWRVSMATPNAYYRVGASGTPVAGGDRRSVLMLAGLGPIIYRVHNQDLVKLGIVSRAKVRMLVVRPVQLTRIPKHGEVDDIGLPLLDAKPNFTRVYKAGVGNNPRRNAAVLEAIRRCAKPCLVFVEHKRHGKLLEKAAVRAGLKVEFVWGEKHVAQRKAALDRLDRLDVEGLICTSIFQMGIDIPDLRGVVVAGGKASEIATLQRRGRGARATTDKHEFEIWDVMDTDCGCHGKDHAECRWFARHARARVKTYKEQGDEVVIEDAQLGLEV